MFKFKRLHSLLRFPVHLILVISILFALLPVVTAASANGTISGYVSDNSTSNPIADADILVFELDAQQPSWFSTTNTSGGYAVSVLEGTDYDVMVHKVGYVSKRVSGINVTANNTTAVNFTLDKGGIIRGIITDNITTNPIPGAGVEAFKPETPQLVYRSLPSSDNGSYSVTVPPGTGYKVVVNKPGYADTFQTGIDAVIDSPVTVNLAMNLQDSNPPAVITDLAVTNPTPNSLTLTWTAPGDDGDTGQASQYAIRYDTQTIDSENAWNAAVPVQGTPVPKSAGQSENFIVDSLYPETEYFFAIKTGDEIPLWSGLSNGPSGNTTAGAPPEGGGDPIMGSPPGMMIGPGMLAPAINMNLSGTSETLVSVTVDILIPMDSSFDPTTCLAPL